MSTIYFHIIHRTLSWQSVIPLIFHTKCAIVTASKNHWVQPLIKRESKWINHKALFPVLEMGVFFWGILYFEHPD
jgi:hypothetical protein